MIFSFHSWIFTSRAATKLVLLYRSLSVYLIHLKLVSLLNPRSASRVRGSCGSVQILKSVERLQCANLHFTTLHLLELPVWFVCVYCTKI